jgi:hypothetical protein
MKKKEGKMMKEVKKKLKDKVNVYEDVMEVLNQALKHAKGEEVEGIKITRVSIDSTGKVTRKKIK